MRRDMPGEAVRRSQYLHQLREEYSPSKCLEKASVVLRVAIAETAIYLERGLPLEQPVTGAFGRHKY